MRNGILIRTNEFMWKVSRPLRSFNIYKRLILTFLAIVTISNLLIGYFSFTISSRVMENKIFSSSVQALKSVDLNINDKLKLYQELSNQIGNNQQIIKLLEMCKNLKNKKDKASRNKYEKYKTEIENIIYQTGLSSDAVNLEILTGNDEFGRMNYNKSNLRVRLTNPDAYRRTKSYNEAIWEDGWPVWIDSAGETGVFQVKGQGITYLGNYLTLMASINDENDNRQLGVVIINVPTKIFMSMIDLQNMYDKREVAFLVGKNGIINILNNNFFVDMPDKQILEEIYKKHTGYFIRKIEGQEYIIVFEPASKAGMVISYMVERRKALTSVYAVRDIIILVALGCIAFTMLLAYLVTISISRPLGRLKKTMEKVEAEGPDFEFKDDSSDEIGILGEKFNVMIKSLKKLMDSVVTSEVLRKNEEIKRKQADLDALQMQINDHFLYNSMDLMRWYAIFVENGDGQLSKMIKDFSTFMRLSTKKTDKLVEIREELDHIMAYFNVLKFKQEFTTQLIQDIKDEAFLKCKITKLSLQPIVENALKYSFNNLDISLEIRINAYKCGDGLYIEIKDNGNGMSIEQLNNVNEGLINGNYMGSGIGLRNVNERIKLSFGKEYGVTVESEEKKFTSVRIYIPYIID